jgi:hypothetical protein
MMLPVVPAVPLHVQRDRIASFHPLAWAQAPPIFPTTCFDHLASRRLRTEECSFCPSCKTPECSANVLKHDGQVWLLAML